MLLIDRGAASIYKTVLSVSKKQNKTLFVTIFTIALRQLAWLLQSVTWTTETTQQKKAHVSCT